MLSTKKIQQFKKTLEEHISECERVLANAEEETRANSARQADTADQAAVGYERQTLAHKADVARQTITKLTDALKRISQGNFGECTQCGGAIEMKRLDAVPWARYCLNALPVCLTLSMLAFGSDAQFVGHWEGTMVREGVPLQVSFDFTNAGGQPKDTFTSLAQKAMESFFGLPSVNCN